MCKKIIITGMLAASTALFGCDSGGKGAGQKPPEAAAPPAHTAVTVPKKFIPPQDSAISERQFGVWKECNILLDSLTFYYANSFKNADPIQTLRLQEDFMKAKDRICRRAGLAGGHEEYKWITGMLANSKNHGLLGFDIWN